MTPPFMRAPFRSGKRSARTTALAQWHGVDLEALEQEQAQGAKSAADIMPKVLSRLGLNHKRIEAEVGRVWQHLVDPDVVAHAHPTGLRKGTLFVTVDSSVWLGEIVRYRRQEILERLQNSFGRELIARISFRLG